MDTHAGVQPCDDFKWMWHHFCSGDTNGDWSGEPPTMWGKNNLTITYHQFLLDLAIIYHQPNEIMGFADF